MELIIKTTQAQFDHFLRNRNNAMPPVHFLPTVKVTTYSLNENESTIYFKGIFHRAVGIVEVLDEAIELRIKATVFWFVYAVMIVWISMSALFFFSSELSINTDLNPSNYLRILFFSIFNLPILIIGVLIYIKTKAFLQSIVDEFE